MKSSPCFFMLWSLGGIWFFTLMLMIFFCIALNIFCKWWLSTHTQQWWLILGSGTLTLLLGEVAPFSTTKGCHVFSQQFILYQSLEKIRSWVGEHLCNIAIWTQKYAYPQIIRQDFKTKSRHNNFLLL